MFHWILFEFSISTANWFYGQHECGLCFQSRKEDFFLACSLSNDIHVMALDFSIVDVIELYFTICVISASAAFALLKTGWYVVIERRLHENLNF